MNQIDVPLTATHLWEVLLLFLIPVGGGIPGGVILAKKYGLHWIMMTLLYFISDVILACLFEPLMALFIRASETSPTLLNIRKAFAKSTTQIAARYGLKPRPFSLVMITFGTDPMTGRTVAKAAGHGFITGWSLVIIGDMMFFFVLMVSTLWLNNILGDGTWTTIIITLAVLGIPPLIKKIRNH